MQQKANPTCSSSWCPKQQQQFAEWSAKQVCCSCAFIALVLFHTVALRAYIVVQPAVRAPVAAAPQVAPAAANEWGITLEDSSVDDASAASGGAVLPEGLFYAFERSALHASSASSSSASGGSAAGAGESVEDLMAALKGL
jgi:hypothetical protein